jgi:HEAT repeat protein
VFCRGLFELRERSPISLEGKLNALRGFRRKRATSARLAVAQPALRAHARGMSPSKRRGRSPSSKDEQEALARIAADPSSDAARASLGAALASKHSMIVKRAAELIKQYQITALVPDLTQAFERLLVDAVKQDPGCHAKLALLEALDLLETDEQETFLRGARHVQTEPAWPKSVDTAAGVRARGIAGLARTGYSDLQLLAGELLADREPPVRQAVADSLAYRGDRSAVGLLLFKLRSGDEDPMVTLAVLSALLALAPDWALPLLEARLNTGDEGERELAAIALGQSRRPEALVSLTRAFEACVQSAERAPLLRAIGLHRSEPALVALLVVIAEGAAADAKAAAQSLAARRFEPGLPERVREAAARNSGVGLEKELRAFAEE